MPLKRWSTSRWRSTYFAQLGGSEKLRIAVMRRATFFIGLELARALFYILRKDGQLLNFQAVAQRLGWALR